MILSDIKDKSSDNTFQLIMKKARPCGRAYPMRYIQRIIQP